MASTKTIISKHLVMKEDLNLHNTLFGGKLMAEMDKAAGIYVMELAKKMAVTLKVSEILFKVPIEIDEIYTISGEIEKLGNTSITVLITVTKTCIIGPPFPMGQEVATASFVMITVDSYGKSTPHGITI